MDLSLTGRDLTGVRPESTGSHSPAEKNHCLPATVQTAECLYCTHGGYYACLSGGFVLETVDSQALADTGRSSVFRQFRLSADSEDEKWVWTEALQVPSKPP